jgi:hypothetical protein
LPFSISDNSTLEVNPLLLSNVIGFYNSIKEGNKHENGREGSSLTKLKRMMDLKRIMKDSSADLMLNEFYHSFEQKDLANIEQSLQEKKKPSQYDIELLKGYANHVKQTGFNLFKKDFVEKAQNKF